MSISSLLRRGAMAGAVAGLCAALVLWLVVEPVIRRALVIEEARGGAHHDHAAEESLVPRGLQVLAGAATALVVGVVFGLVFAVVFARLRRRLPGGTDLGRALVLAAFGFTAFTLLPALTAPANPPGVGDPATVTQRTLVYALAILLGVLGIGAVGAVDRNLRIRGVQDPLRPALVVVAAVLWLVVVLLAVPGSPDTVPDDVPATLLWDFRLASLAQLATMWLVLGLVFGTLVGTDARARRPAAVAR
jgi:predicted cobalt transporter CbtA